VAYRQREIRKAQATVCYTVAGQAYELSLIGKPRAYGDGDDAVLELTAEDQHLRARTRIRARPGDTSLHVDSELSLVDPAPPVRILEIDFLAADLQDTFLAPYIPQDVLFRGEAPDAWTNAANRPLDRPAALFDFQTDTAYVAGGFFHRRTGAGIFAYHVLPHQWIDSVRNDSGRLLVAQKVDVPLRGTDVLQSDRLLLNLADPVTEALDAMAAHQKARRRPAEAIQHTAWNSWDYYKENISHDSIMADVRAIKNIPWLRDRVRYIVIDGFWEKLVGDWEPNLERFPKGMAALAAEITQAGFVPGIWIGPFMADRYCKLLRDHPEYAVQYAGKPYSWYGLIGCAPPWGDRCYLDPTHPRVPQFIYEQLRKIHGWGFRYFKTDFLVDAIRPLLTVQERGYDQIDRSKFQVHDPDIGLARAHRNCMHAIRAAIGEESFWLGCGTFIPSGAELMDASRICADIAPIWHVAKRNSQSAIFSAHLHGNAYLIDPDFAVFRGPQTMDPKQLDLPVAGRKPFDPNDVDSGPPFSEDEARQWASATILCGGLVTLSDRLQALNERGLAIVRTVLDYAGGNAARPLDFAAQVPALWLKRDGERCLLGVFNWDHDRPQRFELKRSSKLPLPRTGKIQELWSGAKVGVAGGLTVDLPPRTAQVFQWTV
jgi:hypothetical protein